MKNLKSKIRLSLCLLTVCFSTFAQTDSHDCEVIVTRADLEKCATFKRQNELLERQIKFQAVETTTLRDTIKARNHSLIILEKNLEDETKSKVTWRKMAIILAVILAILIVLISFGHKLAKFIAVFCLFSIQSFAQGDKIPTYNPPFTLNGQKGVSQKMFFDTTANYFSVFSINNTHTLKVPYAKLFINPGNQFQYFRGDKTWQTLNKTAVGLNNVDNTSDINKPISTATQTALNLKENTIAIGTTSQYYRGDKTWQTLNKTAVGLANVDNTTDLSKPISTATQTALNLKENTIAIGTTSQYYRGDKTWQTLNKTAVGLANVDNTTDLSKPISTATQTALNLKENTIVAGTTSQYYRGDKTWQTLNKTAVGLANVDNTTDLSKPISTATQTALNLKENTIAAGTISQYYRGDKTWQTLDKTTVGLSNVENTALSTWTGSTNIATIGAATASTLRVGASTPYFTMNNYFGSPRLSSTSSLDFFSTGTFSWTTTGDLGQMRLTTTGLKIGSGSASYKIDVDGDIGMKGLIYVGFPSRGISMSSGNVGQFLRKSTINDFFGVPITLDQWSNIAISDVTDLTTKLNEKLSFVNISITNLSDSSTVTHNLNTTKVKVDFFVAEKQNNQISWYPDTVNTIKVYLPVRDKPTQKKFTGDVLIAKRQ